MSNLKILPAASPPDRRHWIVSARAAPAEATEDEPTRRDELNGSISWLPSGGAGTGDGVALSSFEQTPPMTAASAATIAEALGGACRSGSWWRCRCPVHNSSGPTLALCDTPSGLAVHCHAGCRRDDILVELRCLEILDEGGRAGAVDRAEIERRREADRRDRQERTAAAMDIWRHQTEPAEGTVVEPYWRSRGLANLPIPATIRASRGWVRHPEGGRRPAMVAKAPPIDHSTGDDQEDAAVVSPEEETDHGLPATSKGDNVGFGQDASAASPARPDRDRAKPPKTVKTVKTPAAPPVKTGFGSFDTGLQEAVRAATKLGATFRIVGADVEIDGDLPDELRAALPLDQLYAYLGAAAADREAIEFLAQLRVSPILVTDGAGADVAMGALAGADVIGLDLETAPPGARPEPVMINSTGALTVRQPSADKAGLDPHTAIIQTAQLYAGGEHAYVFHGEALRYLLNSEWFLEQHFVAHGADFETKFLQHYLANRVGSAKSPDRTLPLIECTLQGAGLLHGVEGRRRSLAAASKMILNLEPPKLLQTSAWGAPRLSGGQIAYAASDAVLAFRLWREVQPALRSKSRYAAYELQRNVVPAVADMELRGMGFDLEKHAQLVVGWKIDITALEQKIIDLTGQRPPTTKKEKQAWIESVAGDLLATWPRTAKSNELSTTAAAYALLENVPAAKLMLELRAKKKLLSTYGDSIAQQVNPVTGRLHASYSISGAKTGRFTCSRPNLQNQPSLYKAPDYKNLFVAAPGFLLLTGDWKQVELRAMAHVSGDPTMTAVFAAGGDLHIETALAMVGKRREEVSAEELAVLRSRAKAVNFSVIYGSTGKGLAETAWKNYGIKMTVAEGNQAIARFFEKYPKVKQWMEKSLIESTLHGRVLIGCGRVVEAAWEKTHRLSPQQCANHPLQGICADALLRALALTHDRLRAAKITGGIVGSIHDEPQIEVAEADAQKARKILETAMTEVFEQTFPGAPTTGGVVEIKGGPSWGECKLPPSDEK